MVPVMNWEGLGTELGSVSFLLLKPRLTETIVCDDNLADVPPL